MLSSMNGYRIPRCLAAVALARMTLSADALPPVCMYVCYIDKSFSQMRHCKIAPLHQLGFCHNNKYVCIHVCMYVRNLFVYVCKCLLACTYFNCVRIYTVCIFFMVYGSACAKSVHQYVCMYACIIYMYV